MAEETQAAPAAQQFDLNAMAERLSQAAAQGTAQAIERVAQRQQEQARVVQQQQQTQADPVASTILQTVAPHLRELAIKGDSGRDAAVFYATTPAAHRWSGVIEQRFNDLLARNIPVDRASLWNLIKGEQGLTADGIKFEEAVKRRDEEIQRAKDAETIRGSRGGVNTQTRDASSMTTDELSKALEDVAF